MTQIAYHGERVVPIDDPRKTILQISLAHKIPHTHECGGHARCTTCRVRVLDGHDRLSPPTALEREVAAARGWDEYTRLACQTRVCDDAAAGHDVAVTVERLVKTPFELYAVLAEAIPRAGSERAVAVLVSDVRNFSAFAGGRLPYDVVHALNEYYTFVCEPVINNNGFLDKYLGDGQLALFGLKENDPKRVARDAVRAALGIVAAGEEFNRSRGREFGVQFDTGVGIHFGLAIAGEVGHPSRRQFTAIGETVNVACRLEAHNKIGGTRVLATAALVERLGSTISVRQVGPFDGGGEQAAFEILGFATPDAVLLVQGSVWKALADPKTFAAEFYRRVFELAPAARDLFTADIAAQGTMFTHMMRSAVLGLSRFEEILPGLRELGRRHRVEYLVTRGHFKVVRRAFLDTLAMTLGDAFTDELRWAWETTYDQVAEAMQS